MTPIIDQKPGQTEKKLWVTPDLEMISSNDILSGTTAYQEGIPEPFFPFHLGSLS
ncbi:MAG: hypothetical protein ACXVJD_17835 [Mucilaginibacter sp.]